MKQYLIVDLHSEYNKLANIKDIKELLISEIKEDTFNNYEERDVVEGNTKILCSLALDTMTFNDMKKELEVYNYKIIDLLDLQRDLEDVKGYFLDKQDYVGAICETIDKINKEVNKNV